RAAAGVPRVRRITPPLARTWPAASPTHRSRVRRGASGHASGGMLGIPSGCGSKLTPLGTSPGGASTPQPARGPVARSGATGAGPGWSNPGGSNPGWSNPGWADLRTPRPASVPPAPRRTDAGGRLSTQRDAASATEPNSSPTTAAASATAAALSRTGPHACQPDAGTASDQITIARKPSPARTLVRLSGRKRPELANAATTTQGGRSPN